MRVITKIRLFRKPFTIFYIYEKFCLLPSEECYKSIGVRTGECLDLPMDGDIPAYQLLKLRTSALFLHLFVKECLNSEVYRCNVVSHLYELSGYPEDETVYLKLILIPPNPEIIDYSWNERILKLLWMRVEIENAFSWLSTLGGAYSALGDYFEHCKLLVEKHTRDYNNVRSVKKLEARTMGLSSIDVYAIDWSPWRFRLHTIMRTNNAEEAGRISLRQYKLSKMLGDDSLAARSRLYSALSLAQKGNLHIARNIIRSVANFAKITHDKRLIRMCHGVWAKLMYLRSLKNNSKIHPDRNCGNGDANYIRV